MYQAMRLALILLMCCLVTTFHGSDVNSSRVCDERCKECVENDQGLFDGRCNLNGSLILPSPFVLFKSLDLSNNCLKRIPSKFLVNQSRLTNLSLALNNITELDGDAFGQLPQVKFLNLSYNSLRRWKGDVTKQLPSLAELDVTGTTWIPSENILQLPSLRSVIGVSWSEICINCRLERKNITFPVSPLQARHDTMPAKLFKFRFYPNCTSPICASFQVYVKRPRTIELKDISVPRGLFYSCYIMGAIAILLNLVVLITVLLSKSLRQTTSMLLITNMAICDLLVGIYSVITGSLNIFNFLHSISSNPGTHQLVLGGGVLCPLATVLFTSGESVAAITSLLLTVEKYCSIVHCMNPDYRMTRKLATLILLPCWILSAGFAISPFFNVPLLSFSATMMCSFPVAEKISLCISLSTLAAVYLINIPLYVVIFLYVRGSGSQLGVKREAAILKKISLLVCTNFILLVTPMVVLIAIVPLKDIHHTITLKNDQETQVLYIVGFWFPIACLALNACVNPLLCAFRQGQFRKEFKRILQVFPCAPDREVQSASRQWQEGLSASQWNVSSSQVVLYKVTRHDASTSTSA